MSQPKSIALELAAEIEGNPWHLAQKAAAELRRLAGVEAERDCASAALVEMQAVVFQTTEAAERIKAERDRLSAEVEALRKDAERYRWLRQEHCRFDPLCHLVWKKSADRNGSDWVNTDDLDNSIDRAMAGQGKEGSK